MPKSGSKEYKYIRKSFVADGKQYIVCGKTEAEAMEKLAAKKEAVRRAELTKGANCTIEDWADTWLTTYVKPKVRKPGQPKKKGTMTQKSYEMYEDKINGYIIPALRGKKLRSVTDTMLQGVLNQQAEMSESHAKKVRMILRAMFSQAAFSRIIPFDPTIKLTIPASATVENRRSLTAEERAVLMQVAKTHRCSLWIRFLMRTGLRPGECAALRVRHLDMETRLIHVCEAVESGTTVIATPKTSAGDRYVPIPSDIYADLERHISGKDQDDFVFTQEDGKSMMTQTVMTNNWRSFSRQMDIAMGAEMTAHAHIYDPKDLDKDGKPLYPDNAGNPKNGHKIAPDLVLYCLRHTYGTDLQRAGVPINIAKAIMGHSDISVTANVYTDATVEDAMSARDLMDSAIKTT